MFKFLALALVLAGPAEAQTCPTRPQSDNSNACASTAYVKSAVSSGGVVSSVFGRTGAVVSVTNDYSIAQISGLGTGVGGALAIAIGSAGSPVLNGGVLGTPSSGVGTNITGVNAATLGGATFAAPGAIGGTTPSTGAFTALTATSYRFTNLLSSSTAPTISSGFCSTSPSIAANNGTAAFTVNVGTSCSGSTGTVGMPTAANGWVCTVNNLTNIARFDRQTGGTASTVVVTNAASSALQTATNFTASDVLAFACTAY